MCVTPYFSMTGQNFEHHRAAGAEHGPDRPALRVHVEERQRCQIGVVGAEFDVDGVDLGRPERVGVGVHHGLGLGGRAGGEQDAGGQHRVGGALRGIGRIADERRERLATVGELFLGRRDARVVIGDDDPSEIGAGLGDERRELRLGDRSDATGVGDEVVDLARDAAGVGGDRDRTDPGAGVPSDDRLGAVLGVDEDHVALLYAAGVQAGGDLAGLFRELGVGPALGLALLRLPDQERVVAAMFGPVVDEPGNVLTVELEPGHVGRVEGCCGRDRGGHVRRSPRVVVR